MRTTVSNKNLHCHWRFDVLVDIDSLSHDTVRDTVLLSDIMLVYQGFAGYFGILTKTKMDEMIKTV
jgi:hypothetical protein